MISIRSIIKNELNVVSEFIANMNSEKEHHIGYCGCDKDEILNSILEEYGEDEILNCFMGAFDDEELIGLLAVDVDEEISLGELWGPFLKGSYQGQDIEEKLWDSLIKTADCNSYSLFFDKSNCMCMNFAEKLGFQKKSDEIIMILSKKEWQQDQIFKSFQITDEDYKQFEQLHDKSFPNTFYCGDTIIKRINEFRKVFIIKGDNELLGYIYVEVKPEFGESSIEFFVVKEGSRGKGIGKKLISIAISWIFSFESIDDITLCVNGANKNAIKLYRQIGFVDEWDMIAFLYYRGIF